MSLGGVTPTMGQDLERVLAGRKPGDSIPIRWRSRGVERTGTLKLTADETLAGSLDASAPADANRFRATWKEDKR